MKRTLISLFSLVMLLASSVVGLAYSGPVMSADQALTRLAEGNARYVAAKAAHPDQDAARRGDTAKNGQHPFTVILSCADSRVPPEIIFDQGIGDLFIVRVAGNVAATDELGTIEYGVEHLGIPLLMVMGHSQCGAVSAVVNGAEAHGNLAALLAPIVPAANSVKDAPEAERVDKAITANVWQAIADAYAKSPVVKELAKTGKLKVVGALYHLDSGKVDVLGPHPHEKDLLEK